jgi:hypothetical protein
MKTELSRMQTGLNDAVVMMKQYEGAIVRVCRVYLWILGMMLMMDFGQMFKMM